MPIIPPVASSFRLIVTPSVTATFSGEVVVHDEQHHAVGKETGEAAHIERWNNTLCQHIARLVR